MKKSIFAAIALLCISFGMNAQTWTIGSSFVGMNFDDKNGSEYRDYGVGINFGREIPVAGCFSVLPTVGYNYFWGTPYDLAEFEKQNIALNVQPKFTFGLSKSISAFVSGIIAPSYVLSEKLYVDDVLIRDYINKGNSTKFNLDGGAAAGVEIANTLRVGLSFTHSLTSTDKVDDAHFNIVGINLSYMF